jgi:hypothetical protein
MTDEEILKKGTQVLIDKLGIIEAERYISLTLQYGYSNSGFDYTEWRRDNLFVGMSIDEICDHGRKKSESVQEKKLVTQ